MSRATDPGGRQDWPIMEANYWQNTKTARDREDGKLAHDYASRQEHMQMRIVDLNKRKLELEASLREVINHMNFHENEKVRLHHEYESQQAKLVAQRRDEDLVQQQWFARAQPGHAPRWSDKENPDHKHRDTSLPLRPEMRPETQSLPPMDAAGGWTSINGNSLRRSARQEAQEQKGPRDPSNLFSSVFHNPAPEDESRGMVLRSGTMPAGPGVSSRSAMEGTIRGGTTAGASEMMDRSRGRLLKPKEGQGLPDFATVARLNELSDETPEKKRSPRNRKSLPSTRDSATPAGSPAADSATLDEPEITRDSLVLRDNGKMLIEPAMYAGVPLEKIHEQHPFWNPEWESLESIILPQYERWKTKLETLRADPTSVRHSIFLSNRQVNRGQIILDFLRDGCFHPFQFASREVIDKFYKHYINYDTIFRLINVHEELKKFDLDVTPLEWLRHRMHEVSMAQGDKFNLSKTTHDLYHDAKLKQLREKHGFGNIGRPSGYKVSAKDKESGAKAPSTKSRAKKDTAGQTPGSTGRRRTRRSISQVGSDEMAATAGSGEYLEPESPRAKRQRLSVAAVTNQEEEISSLNQQEEPSTMAEDLEADLEHDGYSSTDSYSKDRVSHLDFRVIQVKTKESTTSPKVTQYLVWKTDSNSFEHQVLRDVRPKASWSFYLNHEHYGFEIAQIKTAQYAADSMFVQLLTNTETRGDMLVSFKRERTKRRLLTFLRKKGVHIVKTSGQFLEDAWHAMKSDVVMDQD